MQLDLLLENRNRFQSRLNIVLADMIAKLPTSPEYSHTVKICHTPKGIAMLKVTASARRTSGKDCSGWHTPEAHERTFAPRNCAHGTIPLANQAQTAGWPITTAADSWTPSTPESVQHEQDKNNLRGVCMTAGWPTPDCQNARDGSVLRKDNNLGEGTHGVSLHHAAMTAGWPTPMAQNENAGNCDYTRSVEAAMGMRASKNEPKAGWPTTQARDWKGPQGRSYKDEAMDLPATAQQAGWATPAATEARQGYQDRSRGMKGSQESLTTQAINNLSGTTPAGTPAVTGKPGACQLHAGFSLWLQGFPISWLLCGMLAAQKAKSAKPATSSRSRRRKSPAESCCSVVPEMQ